ncbi:hypothetical protein [Ohessyouella blattaphilus]|uniref:Uncharacterized protein n=1 Tax=Ohessyouella blattaphilus TaxID=2949333 RepID=A0ABT1EIM2_9FIRM|nr:hypothetical protein [Ohessyouella blattaphilus]MCP1110540.1 hypothetical protein [Ohessyouella blattaphilus]MCR8563934.1 hypothetical protein [Ohessyouella blattaphilus]MDL2249462.1 hypothetical protein [Lachnospiraceae bacterium OttesenSCG-928-J05]
MRWRNAAGNAYKQSEKEGCFIGKGTRFKVAFPFRHPSVFGKYNVTDEEYIEEFAEKYESSRNKNL